MSQVGDAFQQDTKYRPDRLGGAELRRGPRPEPYKTYPDSVKVAPCARVAMAAICRANDA